MFCTNCGQEIQQGDKFCPKCGTPQNKSQEANSNHSNYSNDASCATPVLSQQIKDFNVSCKSRTVAALLAFFLGGLGIHRFYVGKAGTAILQILLTCCFGVGCIWALVDLVIILCGNFYDKEGKRLASWDAKY